MKNNYRFGNGGHLPGHYRDAFLIAIEAFGDWDVNNLEPTIEFEVGYEPRPVTISRMCELIGIAATYCRATP